MPVGVVIEISLIEIESSIERAKSLLSQLEEISRAEKGCVYYSVMNQVEKGSCDFLFVEVNLFPSTSSLNAFQIK